ncbi:MAG: hypothetical protein R8G34_12370 [Paracoccaceae bacterium]|nr:hypothetical protein [Paracoccaceae bacterium]
MAKEKKQKADDPAKLSDGETELETSEKLLDSASSPLDENQILEGTLIDEATDAAVENVSEDPEPYGPVEEHLQSEQDPIADVLEHDLEQDPELKEDEKDDQLDDATEAVVETKDEVSDEVAEEVIEEKPSPPPPVQEKSSVWPAVFGGVVAAMLGFIAGRADQLDAYLPASMQREATDLAPLVAQASALNERIEALETVEVPETTPPDLTGLASDAAMQSAMSEIDRLTAVVSELTQRVDTVEARPVETVETIVQQPVEAPDNSEEIEVLQAAVQALQEQISADEALAKSDAQRILAQAALTRVVTAVDSGETFEPALGALQEVAPVEVPDALRAAASEGVPSMSVLRENFPDAARAALAAARAEVPETEVSGIGGFFRRQLNVRSVTPREGSDPDAVLSRAEAAVNGGNLQEALTELDALPDPAKAAMQSWLEDANARQSAREAAQNLADSLTVN